MSKEEIEKLPGVGSKIAEKLVELGYDDLMAIATMRASELASIAEIGEKTANKIINAARENLKIGFITGIERLKERENVRRISTGSKALDELLGGGVSTQCITEFYGPYGSAKTQLAMQLSVNAQMDSKNGGINSGVIYIDTEDTFIPERIMQMGENKGLDPKKVLENIFVARAFNSDHQILLVEKAKEILSKHKIGLLVVDSLTSHFRADYLGRGELAERQQTLNKHIHLLHRLAVTYNISVVVTNQVMARPDLLFGDPVAPIGGHVVGHASAFRVYLRKGKKDNRIARLVDSPYLPEGEVVFKVTDRGIEDV